MPASNDIYTKCNIIERARQIKSMIDANIEKDIIAFAISGAVKDRAIRNISVAALNLIKTYPTFNKLWVKDGNGLKQEQKYEGCIIEHTIPTNYVLNYLLSIKDTLTLDDVVEILIKSKVITIITKDENKLLTKELNKTMPANWTFYDSVFARYEAVGIQIIKNVTKDRI